MIHVKHSVGSKKPQLKTFDNWEKAIEFCLTLPYEMFLWFDIRQEQHFVSYHTNNPTGVQYSDNQLKTLFLSTVERLSTGG